MTDNPHFPSSVPALWVVSTAVTDLQNAETAAPTAGNEEGVSLVSEAGFSVLLGVVL